MSNPRIQKTYLGDGAYAEYDGFGVEVTTENGIAVTNRVYLEPEVFVSLMKYASLFWDLSESTKGNSSPRE